jgi:SAM-dependent methyltransferase
LSISDVGRRSGATSASMRRGIPTPTSSLKDNCADKVVAYDVLEHVGKVVDYRENGGWKREYPFIKLVNEVHRILKPGGIFESLTPCYPYSAVHQDPTHASVITPETWLYFVDNGPFDLRGQYQITARFAIREQRMEGPHLFSVLVASK